MSSPKPPTDPGPSDLGEVLRNLADHARARHREPTLEEILSYAEGEMTPADAESFRERLAVYPEAARRVAVLSDPEASAAASSEAYPPLDLGEIREAIHGEERHRRGSHRDNAQASSPTSPFPAPAGTTVHPAWRVAALVFLALSAALFFLPRSPPGPAATGPSVTQSSLWEIPAADDSRLRGADPTAVAAGDPMRRARGTIRVSRRRPPDRLCRLDVRPTRVHGCRHDRSAT